jgi:outer membrane protein OmpA-like peptidoglycan-associated protein
MTHPRLLAALGLLALAGCVTGGKLQRTAEVLTLDAVKARSSGAMRCAPRELALAEANLDFGKAEIDWGNASRAADYLKVAEQNMKKALELSRNCAPAQVTIRDKKLPPPAVAPAVIVIEKVDTEVKDSDGDGIPDDIDRCPLDPEDFDGFQDEDGCPDPDNDGDGVVDQLDACPNTPGPLSNRGCPIMDRDGDGIPDDIDKCPDEPGPPPDGCPRKYTLVEVKKDRIAIKQQVHFQSARWTVLKDSYALLDQVVQVLKDYPKMRVSVEGHTDAIGGEVANMKLSQARAESVRTYLASKGIGGDRLEAIGFGSTKPIASNKTEKGRGQNRRTEFRIISTE